MYLVPLIWLLFAIAAAIAARARNRSGVLYFILGIALGPFALLFALVARPYTGSLKTCPDCAEQIQWNARKCRYCGADLGPPQARPSRLEQAMDLWTVPPKDRLSK